MSELPEGWAEASIKELFVFKYGKGLPQELRSGGGGIPVYGSNGRVGEHDRAFTSGVTIIVGRKGSVGEVHISREKCWPIDTTYFIDEFPCELPPDYWALYLKYLRLGQQEKSSAIPGISRDDIYRLTVPLPPLIEQRRILAKLEEMLAKVDACQRRLAKIPLILKRFRQSVLAASCSGRLTADWREGGKEPQIMSEAWCEPEGTSVIPNSWRWKKLSDMTQIRGGVTKGRKLHGRKTILLPYLRVANVQDGFLDLSEIKHIEACLGTRKSIRCILATFYLPKVATETS